MVVKFLKSGNFALHPVYGPVIKCVAGETMCLGGYRSVKDLVACGWAIDVADIKPVVKEEPKQESAPAKADEAPWEKADWSPRAKDAKDQVQAYADQFGLDLDLRKNVKKLITIVEKYRQ